MHPNLLYVFADQWRGQAAGYAGDPNALTPHLDNLSNESLIFDNAISSCPVCCPARASLMTGQYPHQHGVFLNDVPLRPKTTTFAEVLQQNGYRTGYIGKWHLDGHGRLAFIPPERRLGFTDWHAVECTHNYNDSLYYSGDDPTPRKWPGYDLECQTDCAIEYLRQRSYEENPFALFLAWGPPHNPYETAPERCQTLFKDRKIILRPNVPASETEAAVRDLRGYYSHLAALDHSLGRLVHSLKTLGLAQNTMLVVTSDHGDMLHSHGLERKQHPFEESIRIPLLLRPPSRWKWKPRRHAGLIDIVDHMPTFLRMLDLSPPEAVQGRDRSHEIAEPLAESDSCLVACYAPSGEYRRNRGGKEYRGLRTDRYLYVADLQGPWLLYDLPRDPYQLKNLVSSSEHHAILSELDAQLRRRLEEVADPFAPAGFYINKWNYRVNETGSVPF